MTIAMMSSVRMMSRSICRIFTARIEVFSSFSKNLSELNSTLRARFLAKRWNSTGKADAASPKRKKGLRNVTARWKQKKR